MDSDCLFDFAPLGDWGLVFGTKARMYAVAMREVMQRRLTSLACTIPDMIRAGMYAMAEKLGTARKMRWWD